MSGSILLTTSPEDLHARANQSYKRPFVCIIAVSVNVVAINDAKENNNWQWLWSTIFNERGWR